jgi:hypothetical protein
MSEIHRPTADEIRAARIEAELDRAAAAALVHLGHANRWAEYENEARTISLATWELFLLKTGQHPQLKATRKKVAA